MVHVITNTRFGWFFQHFLGKKILIFISNIVASDLESCIISNLRTNEHLSSLNYNWWKNIFLCAQKVIFLFMSRDVFSCIGFPTLLVKISTFLRIGANKHTKKSWHCGLSQPYQLLPHMTPTTDYGHMMEKFLIVCGPNSNSNPNPKLFTPSTLNIDLILWHTQLNMCAVK